MRPDVIVLGLGAMGSATCHRLAARGVRVLGIDRYAPPHAFGSTHGDTRITRLAVGEGREYVPLVARSHELWREIESETGAQLLTITGGLTIAPPTSTFLADVRAIAADFGIAHENLPGSAIADRFPMFGVAGRLEGYYERGSGYVRPEAAVAAQLELARRSGATLLLGEQIVSFAATAGGGVSVVTAGGARHDADGLVLCAGPWLPELWPAASALVGIYRQLLFWFPIERGFEQLRAMPIFVWDLGGEREGFVHLPGFYGFPAVDRPASGLKVATERYDATTVPDGRQHPATPEEAAAMYRDCIAERLPWLGAEPVRSVSCLYTCTAGSRFLIDRHPEHDNVVIVSACSGHGFKHSPAIGEAVAQWLCDGRSSIDLVPFALGDTLR